MCLILKPGGRIGVHTPADTAYVGAVVLRKVFAKYGVSLEASNRIGSVKQCQDLFINAGFEAVEIRIEQHGSYTNLEKAKATWEGVVVRPSSTSLKVLNNGLSQLSLAQLAEAKAEFNAELESLQTEEGIWDNLTRKNGSVKAHQRSVLQGWDETRRGGFSRSHLLF